jgi:acetyl-CoA C-acetyltransferase
MAPQIIVQEGTAKRHVSSIKHDGLRCAFSDKPMGAAAEWLARRYGITREEQDQYAFNSHRLAVQSIERGLFNMEIITVPAGNGKEQSVCERDECPRRDSTMEKLASLKPAFEKDGTVTAGNAAPLADGAAEVLISSEEYAAEKGIRPLAQIRYCCTAGVKPIETFTAPIVAVKKLLADNTLTIDDIDIFEANDSFAAQAIACQRELSWDPKKVNTRGGTLALGHPLGTSGCRIVVTLLHILLMEKKKLGVAAICLGGGNAVAMLVENLRL